MSQHERKNLGIEGAVSLPDSDYFLVPGSLWNKLKTIIHGEPESDEEETELLVDLKGKLILDEQGKQQEVFRRRSLTNPKDLEYFKDGEITVFKSFEEFQQKGGEAFDLYVGEDGKLYDPASDTWMENHLHEAIRYVSTIYFLQD